MAGVLVVIATVSGIRPLAEVGLILGLIVGPAIFLARLGCRVVLTDSRQRGERGGTVFAPLWLVVFVVRSPVGQWFHPAFLVERPPRSAMVGVSARYAESLERRSPLLFFLAGVVLLLLLMVGSVVRFTVASIPRTTFWPLFPLAIALSLGGLVGLCPRLAERARWSAIVGGGFGTLGGIALITGLGALLVTAPPGPYPGNLGVVGAPFFLGLLAFVPAVGICGISGLRTGLLSRKVGALLLVIGLLQFGELVGAEVVFSSAGTSAPSGFYVLFETFVYGLIATAFVTIGYSLRNEAALAEREDKARASEFQAEAS